MDEHLERRRRNDAERNGFSSPSKREGPPSPDGLLSAVAHEYRRATLELLQGASDETLAYDALVDGVADRVRDEDAARASDDHRRRVRIALHHTHLPKLEEAGMVDHEAHTGHVQFVGGELERELLSLVEPDDSHE